MEENTTTAKKSQGDKVAEDKKDRNPSSTYTIKSLAGNIKKLGKLKMCNAQEIAELKKIHKAVMERWIGGNLGL